MTKEQDVPEQPEAAEPAAPAETAPELDDAARIAALEAELQDTKDKWLRAQAEMANLRARTKREV